jgi:ATP-dependent DNA helicase RecG
MKPKEKNSIMERFAEGKIQVLVSTTVVEVGVNVPNATVMMVENAERFGLAQLHQLRGRVGRGEHQSYCIFVCGTRSKEARERLEILNKSNDGFYIAEEDLKLRGPGDLFGIRQSGELDFKIGNIYTDASILKLAAQAAKSLDDDEAEMIFTDNPHLERKILNQDSGIL